MKQSGEVWTVSRLTTEIRQLLENGIPVLWVEGELSNYKLHTSGHRYFTLRDEAAQMACVMWRTRSPVGFVMADGIKIRAYGCVSVWEQGGRYQFDVQSILPAGLGTLQAAFEILKNKLAAEGLFDLSRKRLIPKFPRRVGVITSRTGAVIHDLCWGFKKRFPATEIYLLPVAVQGEGAAKEIAEAIEFFNCQCLVDVIIVSRGGGSLEDLWPFNEEIVVRAVASSEIPVVSAVGHEVDVTLCDLVADLRAPTPTAAATLIVPDREDLFETLLQRKRNLLNLMSRTLALWNEKLRSVQTGYSFRRMTGRISDERLRLDELSRRMEFGLARIVDEKMRRFESVTTHIEALSPRGVLGRGYCIAKRESNGVVRDGGDLNINETLELMFFRGGSKVLVEKTWTND